MRIHEEGFRIAMQKELQLNRDQAENFYNDHRGQPYFDELISRMTMYANCVLTMYANLMLMFYVPPLMLALCIGFGQLLPETEEYKKLRYREEHSASVVLSWCTV